MATKTSKKVLSKAAIKAANKAAKTLCACGQKSVHGSVFCPRCLADVQAYNNAITKKNNPKL